MINPITSRGNATTKPIGNAAPELFVNLMRLLSVALSEELGLWFFEYPSEFSGAGGLDLRLLTFCGNPMDQTAT